MNKLTPEVERRQAIERRIARVVINSLLKAGYRISIDNGAEDELITPKQTGRAILAAMFQTDEEKVYVYRANTAVPLAEQLIIGVRPVGWVYFVYGNDGWDVVSDYTTNLEDIMTEANKLADKLGA